MQNIKKETKKRQSKDISSELQSTREAILDKSLELINDGGMVDFRIDALATSLNLSPGNITYHFSRKEDISVALWERYLQEYSAVERALTTLLDLKQVFLLNRINMHLNYRYRGVLIFRSADLGAMSRDFETGRTNQALHIAISTHVLDLLRINGYMKEDESTAKLLSIVHTYHYLVMRWSINFVYQLYPYEEISEKIDHMALLCLHAIYPVLTEKGQAEFADIARVVDSGKLLAEA